MATPVQPVTFPIVVPLQYPIQRGQTLISELHFRRGKAKELRLMDGGGSISEMLDVAAQLCGQPPSVMDEVDMDDIQAVCAAVEKCLPSSRTTG